MSGPYPYDVERMAELPHPAFEEYCEAIYELREDDLSVIQARIAERLGVARAGGSEKIRRMTTEGLVSTTNGTVSLSDTGRALAEQVVRRHRLAERFLTDILGLSWAEAHHEAGKWEHVLSEPVEAAINRLLDNPTTCPHGNPIPGSEYEAPDAIALCDLAVAGDFTVSRIPEELEFTPGLLEFLEDSQIQPGRAGTVEASSPDGTMTVRMGERVVGIGSFASQRILVAVS